MGEFVCKTCKTRVQSDANGDYKHKCKGAEISNKTGEPVKKRGWINSPKRREPRKGRGTHD